jgi:hypothetical protein
MLRCGSEAGWITSSFSYVRSGDAHSVYANERIEKWLCTHSLVRFAQTHGSIRKDEGAYVVEAEFGSMQHELSGFSVVKAFDAMNGSWSWVRIHGPTDDIGISCTMRVEAADLAGMPAAARCAFISADERGCAREVACQWIRSVGPLRMALPASCKVCADAPDNQP